MLDDSLTRVCMPIFVSDRKAATVGIQPADISEKEKADETK